MVLPPSQQRPDESRLARRLRSFGAAIRGLGVVLAEVHSRVHLVATLLVVAAGWYFRLTAYEWCAVVIAVGFVWSAEAMNTALEHLSDAAVPERHPLVRAAKDAAAAGVLLAAITSTVIAAIVFLPKLL